VANDVLIDRISGKISIVNGANGAGKTTYLKMIALNLILA
jgi:DNA mismatch repair ATPase MutS